MTDFHRNKLFKMVAIFVSQFEILSRPSISTINGIRNSLAFSSSAKNSTFIWPFLIFGRFVQSFNVLALSIPRKTYFTKNSFYFPYPELIKKLEVFTMNQLNRKTGLQWWYWIWFEHLGMLLHIEDGTVWNWW